MSYADSRMEDLEQLYIAKIVDDKGNVKSVRYAYGLPWVAQALYMDDIYFDSPEEAKEWWEKRYGN